MSLFETGKDNLINEFKEHLAKHSQTIPPITVLDALATDEGLFSLFLPSIILFI
jgi:hypothetical protein